MRYRCFDVKAIRDSEGSSRGNSERRSGSGFAKKRTISGGAGEGEFRRRTEESFSKIRFTSPLLYWVVLQLYP
jgi:hypothetical protein